MGNSPLIPPYEGGKQVIACSEDHSLPFVRGELERDLTSPSP